MPTRQTSASVRAVLDVAATLVRMGDDHELFDQLAATALATAPAELQHISEAISVADCARAFFLMHRLRGSLSSFVARPAMAAAKALEAAAREGEIDTLRSMLPGMEHSLQALLAELRASMEGRASVTQASA